MEVLGEKLVPVSLGPPKSHTDQIPGLRSERPSTNHVTHGTVFERKGMWINLIEHGPIRDASQNRLEI